MSKLEFLTQHVVNNKKIEAIGVREFYIDRVIAQSTINIIYAPAGTGKTWLSFALCGALINKGLEVIYLDNDNGVHLLKDRGWDRFIDKYEGKFHYINGDMMDDPKEQMQVLIKDLHKRAEDNFYANVVVVYDSLQFFMSGGMYDEGKIDRFTAVCKAIRRNGGIVIALNHSTKNGLTMKGGGSLTDAADDVWHARNVFETADEKHFLLTPEKKRNNTEETGYSLNIHTMKLMKIDSEVLSMTDMEKEFIPAVQVELFKDDNGVSQSDLLKALGRAVNNKFGCETLKKHDGKFWQSHMDGKKRMYKKIN